MRGITVDPNYDNEAEFAILSCQGFQFSNYPATHSTKRLIDHGATHRAPPGIPEGSVLAAAETLPYAIPSVR